MAAVPRIGPMTEEMTRIRACLEGIPAYVPGKPAPAESAKLSSNESPFPPLPAMRDAVVAEVDGLNRYPDAAAVALRTSLAEKHGVDWTQIHVSTGASSVLGEILRAVAGAGDEVVFPWRSFELYPIIVQSHGCDQVRVPLTEDHRMDLDAIADAITDRTRLVFLCTPNNPSGTCATTEELRSFLQRIPSDIAVCLDEAYGEFAGDLHPDADALFREFGNVVRLKTFSKVHGIAGLRLGYAIAHPKLAAALGLVTMPFAANTLAQAAAVAALEPAAAAELQERVEFVIAERQRIVEALELDLPACGGNFVFLPLAERSGEFADFARERGLVVRAYGTDGARISIGTAEENDRTIAVVGEWFASAPSDSLIP